ncbi:hypothetical protein H5410_036213, partial [Solanum commersonii]
MEDLRSCVKAQKLCATESYGELHDFALNKLKGIGDELIIILKSAIREVIGFLLFNMYLHVCWLHSIINSRTVLEQSISSFISKHCALFELLESLTTKSLEGLRASQLACRVSIIPNIYVHLSPVSGFYVFFWLIEFRWLFRKATLASTALEALGYSPDESILQKFWKICERQTKYCRCSLLSHS